MFSILPLRSSIFNKLVVNPMIMIPFLAYQFDSSECIECSLNHKLEYLNQGCCEA